MGRHEWTKTASYNPIGLEEAADRPVRTFSGGMRRRLDLAGTLTGRPEVVFLDEPSTGLDPAARQALWAMVRRLAAEGVAILLTTQYLQEADELADRITVLSRGQAVAEGTRRRNSSGRSAVNAWKSWSPAPPT